MADLSKLTDEQLEVYRDLLAKKQAPAQPVQPPVEQPSAWQELGRGNIRKALGTDWQQGLIGTGLRQAGAGVKGLVSGPGAPERYRGLSDVIHGVGTAMAPVAIPLALASPLSAAGGFAAGLGGSKAGETIAHRLGASPEAESAAGDLVGLVTGGLGSRIGQATEGAIARPLIKNALRLPGKSEAFGADPAQMALEHTRGVRPATIASSAQDSITKAKGRLEQLVQNWFQNPTTPVDLGPGRTSLADAEALASRQGNKTAVEQLQPMREALQGNRVTGTPYSQLVSPAEALDLKRGFGDEFVSFNPDIHESVNAAGRNVRGDLARQIHTAVPGSLQQDQIMQGLIPVKNAAQKTGLAATLGQRVLSRVARPTGGMLPALMGFHEAGIPGAMLGLTGAEAASSPIPLAIAARVAHAAGKTFVPPVTHLPLTRRQQDQQ